jgi:recombination protein RecA
MNDSDLDALFSKVTKDIKKSFKVNQFEKTTEFLSTGNAGINFAISGKADGGFPVGKISELAGENATGKTLLGLHALVVTQKRGGVPIIVDAEYAFNPAWFEQLGGNPDRVYHYEPKHIEDSYDYILETVQSIRKHDEDVPITILYDSIAAPPSAYEYKKIRDGASLEDVHDMARRARSHGTGIRMLMGLCSENKVTFISINQYRATMAMFGPDKDTVGGKSWKYAAGVRIDMKKGKPIKRKLETGREKHIGIAGTLRVSKNRYNAPFKEAEFDIYYSNGIDPISGLFDVLVDEEIIKPKKVDGKVSKGWWEYKGEFFQKGSLDKIIEKFPELVGDHELLDIDKTDVRVGEFDEETDDAADADM